MCSPRDIGGLGLLKVRLYNLAFEISRLSMHWKETDPKLSWIKIGQELTCPFKPLNALSHGLKTDGHHDSSKRALAHSKDVWKEVHRMCGVFHLRRSYASLWHNVAIRIGKKSVYWNSWLIKGIHRKSDLYLDGVFMSFSELVQRYDLDYKGNFWKYLQRLHH